jgi:exodeoxyribonuclease V alpha subunit
VPFHRAEQSLAGSVLRLLGDRVDRMAQFTGIDWDKALT